MTDRPPPSDPSHVDPSHVDPTRVDPAGDLCEVCVTAPDADWLAELTARLVTDRYAACGHLTGPIRSIYRWHGDVADEPEARVALHTRRALIPTIVAAVTAVHPYELPGIFALPLIDASSAYQQWIRDETTSDAGQAGQEPAAGHEPVGPVTP
jgi:periplasmic divalent cation tolerance protein